MAATPKAAPPTAAPNTEASKEKVGNFLNETFVELKKTTWPTRQEATRLTCWRYHCFRHLHGYPRRNPVISRQSF